MMTRGTPPTVLLTGATGFLGSRLLGGLIGSGVSVIVAKRSWSDAWRIKDLIDRTTVFDVDKAPLRTIFGTRRIDAVIHAATSYGRAGERVDEVIEANVVFPMRLLELAAEFGSDVFLNTDSFSTKGADLPEGLQYYALSKKHFREYGYTFADTHQIRFANVQLEHVYGPNDHSLKFVPTLLRALLQGQSTFDLTPGEQLRDFIYVDDVVAAYLTLLEHYTTLPAPSVHVEVGWGRTESLKDASLLALELSKGDTQLVFGAIPYRKGELMESRADTALLKRIGWVPIVSLREGLERTISAMRSQLDLRRRHEANEV